MVNNYLNDVKKQFLFYKLLGEKTFNQLTDAQLFWQYNGESNSVSIIVNHLYGNMLSRWTDFLTSDGEKEWRERDAEFEDIINSRDELLQKWESGWECLFNALETVNEDNFSTIVYIRNQAHTIPEAVNRQLAHYAYHVGQIVFIGKMAINTDWESLSIPKGASAGFNAKKMIQGKHGGHFSDDLK